jgi:hypothetical protein
MSAFSTSGTRVVEPAACAYDQIEVVAGAMIAVALKLEL